MIPNPSPDLLFIETESTCSLYRKKKDTLSHSIERRQTPFSTYKEERVYLFFIYNEETYSFSIWTPSL